MRALLIALLTIFLLAGAGQLRPLRAQDAKCPALVYYGAQGQDAGDCANPATALCHSHAYALRQGQAVCPSEVLVFGDGMLREVYRRAEVRALAPVDLAVAAGYWLAPLLAGGVCGWWAARWWTTRRPSTATREVQP